MASTICWAVKARFSTVGAAAASPAMDKSPVAMAEKRMVMYWDDVCSCVDDVGVDGCWRMACKARHQLYMLFLKCSLALILSSPPSSR